MEFRTDCPECKQKVTALTLHLKDADLLLALDSGAPIEVMCMPADHRWHLNHADRLNLLHLLREKS